MDREVVLSLKARLRSLDFETQVFWGALLGGWKERLGIIMVEGAEGPEGEERVGDRDGEVEEVKRAPFAAVGDEGGGDQGADGAADSVAAVESAEGCGWVRQVGAERLSRLRPKAIPRPMKRMRARRRGMVACRRA